MAETTSDASELDNTIPFEEPVDQLNLFEAEDDILSSVKAAEALQEEIKQLHVSPVICR